MLRELIVACLVLLPWIGEEARAATVLTEVSEAPLTVNGTLVFQSASRSGTTSRSIFDAVDTDILDFGVGLSAAKASCWSRAGRMAGSRSKIVAAARRCL